jgi:hypothetical protein
MSSEKIENGTNFAAIVEKSEAVLYPRSRCLHLRATCMQQARKHKEAGRKSVMLEWLGHAAYWSTRARTGLDPDTAQDIASVRGKRFAVRSTAEHKATREAAVAGMAAPSKGAAVASPAPVVPVDTAAVAAFSAGLAGAAS